MLHLVGPALCLVSAAGFGALAIFGKLAYDDGVGVVTLLAFRFGLAAAVLLILAALTGRLRSLAPTHLRTGFLLGAVGYAAQAGLFFAALERMDASLLSLLLYTYPAMVVLAALVLGRERPTLRRLGALLAASTGVALVLLGAAGQGFDMVGAFMGLGAAAVYTTYILVSDGVVGDADPVALSAVVASGATVTFVLVGLSSGSLQPAPVADAWLWVALIALVSTVVAVLAFFAGLRRVGASTASILSTFEPPVTVALAFLAFGESLGPVQLVGGALVLCAVALAATARPAGEPAPA